MNRLAPEKEQKVTAALLQPGYSIRGIERDTGVSRPTIRKIEKQKLFEHNDSKLPTLSFRY